MLIPQCVNAVTFSYTGGVQTVTVPSGVTSMTVTAYGAGGGSVQPSSYICYNGYGAIVTATFSVTAGTTYYVYVGGVGTANTAGYNGGGSGAATGYSQGWTAGGCGATDVRTTLGDLYSRIIVAGGGGGADCATGQTGYGGHAGLDGTQGCNESGGGGYGGSTTNGAGGAGSSSGGYAGTFGYGGAGNNYYGGGGGGGWYGGGGGYLSCGGGGSSYPSTASISAASWASGNGQCVITFSSAPSILPSRAPSARPSCLPTLSPTLVPSCLPTLTPTVAPSRFPSVVPSIQPSLAPTVCPTIAPSLSPTRSPTHNLKYSGVSQSYSYQVVNAFAFAAVTKANTVVTWGADWCGGDSTSISSLLVSVISVVSSTHAFAALKSDGSVVAWGRKEEIAGSVIYRGSSNIVSLIASEQAFAGITADGGVFAFGSNCCGGNVDQYGWAQFLTSDVHEIRASAGSFCALKTDGTVYCWGNSFTGGGVSSLTRSDLVDIVLLAATRSAFAGLTSTGSVLVWGNKDLGGSLSSDISQKLVGKTDYVLSGAAYFVAFAGEELVSWGDTSFNVVGNFSFLAFTTQAVCALRTNGSVVSWGEDVTLSPDSSENITTVVGNSVGFSAITTNGRLLTWGYASNDDGMNINSSMIIDTSTIFYTSRAFAVLNDSAVLVWGDSHLGGSLDDSWSSNVSTGVKLICANGNSFTAIMEDGSAYGWGYSKCNLNGLIEGNFSSISSC